MDGVTGETDGTGLRVAFDPRLQLAWHGALATSDAGLVAFRERDDAVDRSARVGDVRADRHASTNGPHGVLLQFGQTVLSRLAGSGCVSA